MYVFSLRFGHMQICPNLFKKVQICTKFALLTTLRIFLQLCEFYPNDCLSLPKVFIISDYGQNFASENSLTGVVDL